MNHNQNKPLKLTLVVAPDEEDDNYRDEQARLLRDLIEDQIDGAEAELVTGGSLPKGVRAGEVITAGVIALALLPITVKALLELLRDWGNRRYKIKVGDIEVELPGDSTWEAAEDRIKRLLALQDREKGS